MIALTQQSNIIDEVIHGEALAVLRTLPDNSVDAIVCDPPAGISFMGKDWDNYSGKEKTYNSAGARAAANADKEKLKRIGQGTTPYGFSSSSGQTTKKERDAFISFITEIMAEALRVLKPGGHAFVWSLPRTSHWTGMALEDAGWEIRDCVNHFYDASTLMQQFLASLTSSQSDAFKALMDSQSAPSLVSHIFGSGFPKSANISKAIDKMQGAEREVIGHKPKMGGVVHRPNGTGWDRPWQSEPDAIEKKLDITAPATPEASQWNGWGTALKPSSEHWWLCRKPLSEPTIAANVLKWGVGAINIDASRINPGEHVRGTGGGSFGGMFGNGGKLTADPNGHTQGRFPANLLLSHSVWCVPNGVKKVKGTAPQGKPSLGSITPNGFLKGAKVIEGCYEDSEGMEQVEDWLCDESCPVRLLDEQGGYRKSGAIKPHINKTNAPSGFNKNTSYMVTSCNSANEGYVSRYFQRFSPFIYQAKASRSERNRGCEGLPEQNTGVKNASGRGFSESDPYKQIKASNNHPTVKPLQLMRYLVRMITPPGGIVLDCFAGSGSTLVAAIHEGMHFIGIEMNDSEQEPYVSIARARIEQAFREVQ